MHYPVNVFTGKVREYEGSRPSAIAKVQVDGELTLTDLGLAGDQQAEKKNPRRARSRAVPLSARALSALENRIS